MKKVFSKISQNLKELRDTPYLSVFSTNARECGKNADQNYSEYGRFLRSVYQNYRIKYYDTLTFSGLFITTEINEWISWNIRYTLSLWNKKIVKLLV